jgi:two-component system cell cycle response regulator
MRIALVDQSRAVQRAMTNLIGLGGHDVVAFNAGEDALAGIAADDSITALITSVHLPDISGLDLCSAARKLAGGRRPLVIIVMSSIEDFALVVKALDNGADDFIHKPPIVEELQARLRAADRFTSMQRDLIKYATTDSLTGLLNRRVFFERSSEACQTTQNGKDLSAILFDIDHFKRINDTHGHHAGDVVLANIGATIKAATNETAGRLGGEEFGVLQHCQQEDGLEFADMLRCSIKNLRFPEYLSLNITCSFGVAEWEPADTVDRLLRRADLAMYQAKATGRDRVIGADHFVLTDRHDRWRGITRVGTKRGVN